MGKCDVPLRAHPLVARGVQRTLGSGQGLGKCSGSHASKACLSTCGHTGRSGWRLRRVVNACRSLGWHNKARLGPAQLSLARHDRARPLGAQPGTARQTLARLGKAGPGSAQQDPARLDSAQLSAAQLARQLHSTTMYVLPADLPREYVAADFPCLALLRFPRSC